MAKDNLRQGIIDQLPWVDKIYDDLNHYNLTDISSQSIEILPSRRNMQNVKFWKYLTALIKRGQITQEMDTKQIWKTTQNIMNKHDEGIIPLMDEGYPHNIKVSRKTLNYDENIRDTDNQLPVDKIISGHNYVTTEWENKGLILGIEPPRGLTKERFLEDYKKNMLLILIL